MELKEAILKRRSVRKFSNEQIKENDLETILHMASAGPSAMNKKPWEFYVIRNKELLKQVRFAGKYEGYESPLAIVVAGNMDNALPNEMQEYWVQDCSAATENILLAATSLGLGSVWEGIYPIKQSVNNLQKLLNLPSNLIPLNIIYIGYPLENPEARDQYDENKIHIIK